MTAIFLFRLYSKESGAGIPFQTMLFTLMLKIWYAQADPDCENLIALQRFDSVNILDQGQSLCILLFKYKWFYK